MLFILIAGVLTYWLKVIEEPIKRQWRAADQIADSVNKAIKEESAGRPKNAQDYAMYLAMTGKSEPTIKIRTSYSPVPSWMKWRFEKGKSAHIESLEIKGVAALTLDELKPVENLTYLKTVQLEELGVTDAHAELLSKVTSLRFVNLPNGLLTDEGAKLLARLPALESLDLQGNPVSWRSKYLLPDPDLVLIDASSNYDFKNVDDLELFAKSNIFRLSGAVLINPTQEMLLTLKTRFDLANIQQLVLKFDGESGENIPLDALAEWVGSTETPVRDLILTEAVDPEYRQQLLALLARDCQIALYDDFENGGLPRWWFVAGFDSKIYTKVLKLDFPAQKKGFPHSGLNTVFITGNGMNIEDVKAIPSLQHLDWSRMKLR